MIATVRNMRRCEAAGVAVVMLNTATGETLSANPRDYFWAGVDDPFDGCVLADKPTVSVTEISEDDLTPPPPPPKPCPEHDWGYGPGSCKCPS